MHYSNYFLCQLYRLLILRYKKSTWHVLQQGAQSKQNFTKCKNRCKDSAQVSYNPSNVVLPNAEELTCLITRLLGFISISYRVLYCDSCIEIHVSCMYCIMTNKLYHCSTIHSQVVCLRSAVT